MSLESFVAILKETLDIYIKQLPMVLLFITVFSVFSLFKSQASIPGKVWWRSRDLSLDATYGICNMLIAPYMMFPASVVALLVFSPFMTTTEIHDYFAHGRGPLSVLPFWWQALAMFVICDFVSYWIHRVFHGSMWRFHAIHHSGTEIDWTTAYRFHPINLMLQPMMLSMLAMSLGIAPEVMSFFIPIEALAATWVHSNSNWDLGPLKYVFVTPVFHRWHHSAPDEGGNSNFSTTFAFWDLLFGTFYMPEGKRPQNFGVDDPHFPNDYVSQMAYPFRIATSPPISDPASAPAQ